VGGSQLGIRFSLQDSTTSFPHRNNFAISVLSGSGYNLFSLVFTATGQAGDYDDPTQPLDPATSNALWNLQWTSGAFASGPLAAVPEDGAFDLLLDFTADGSDVDFTMTIDGALNDWTETGTLVGPNLAGENFQTLRVRASQGLGADWGDNFLTFQGVPEPATTAVLGFGLGVFALLGRRRP
jgi:hypothetical protein